MKYSDLIEYIYHIVTSYNASVMTPDSHFQQHLKQNPVNDPNQRMFIKQVYYGLQRYHKFLMASNQVLCVKYHPQMQISKDWVLLSIFTYILCFRLGQLPIKEYQKMVRSQNKIKMQLLHYSLFDQQFVNNNLLQVWRDHLEEFFLLKKIVPYLSESKDKCWDLLINLANQQSKSQLMHKSQTGSKNLLNFTSNFTQRTNKNKQFSKDQRSIFKDANPINSSKSENKHIPTFFQQFKLTKPKPKLIPNPQKILNQFIASPMPKKGKTLQHIISQKSKRLQQMKVQIKNFYEQKNSELFVLETSKRPSSLSKIEDEGKIRQIKQMKRTFKARPMPNYRQVQIKQNVANILRQQKRINQNLWQQELKLKELMVNLRDDTQYKLHQKYMQDADNYVSMQTRQRTKIEIQLARQAAMQAYQQKINAKKQLVNEMKSMSDKLRFERQLLNDQLMNNNKKIINDIGQMRQNVQLEVQKMIENNKKEHEKQKMKRKRIRDMKKQEDHLQLQKKRFLISQIREFQKNLKNIPRRNIEQQNSIGLMSQMCVQQLKKRLIQVKAQQKQQQQQRRKRNMIKQEQFRQSLNMKESKIYEYRNNLSKQRSLQIQRRCQQKRNQQKRINEAKIKSLNQFKRKEQEQNINKLREKQKIMKQQKQIEQKNGFLLKDKAAVQKQVFQSIQKGQQRQILNRQNAKLINQYNYQIEKLTDMKHFFDSNKKQIQNKIAFNRLYNQKQQFENKSAQLLQQEQYISKAMKYHQVRKYEKQHIENMQKNNPYRKKAADLSWSKAKKGNTSSNKSQLQLEENPEILYIQILKDQSNQKQTNSNKNSKSIQFGVQ